MRRRSRRCRDPLALEVGERLDALVGMHPELRGRDLDIVDQKHLALAARGEIRKHGAGGEHIKAAADQRLEKLEAGVELAQLELESLAVERAPVHAGPDLTIDGERVQIADADLRPGLRERGRRQSAESQPQRCRQKSSSMHDVLPSWVIIIEHDLYPIML